MQSRAPHGARGLKLLMVLLQICLDLSRPAWGAWIEINGSKQDGLERKRSRPAWGAWIEIFARRCYPAIRSMSRPAWGAWIEIAAASRYGADTSGRAPHGARGLKCTVYGGRYDANGSRPAWGAWIEIDKAASASMYGRSRPAWGAWIEINRSGGHGGFGSGRAPHGARGLKFQFQDDHTDLR